MLFNSNLELLEEYNFRKIHEGKYLYFNGAMVNVADMCKAKQAEIVSRYRRLYGNRLADRLVRKYLS